MSNNGVMFILKIDTTSKCSHLKLWLIPSSASHPYTSSSVQTVQLCERHDSYKPEDCKNLINRLHVHTCLYSCFRPKELLPQWCRGVPVISFDVAVNSVLCYILQCLVLLKSFSRIQIIILTCVFMMVFIFVLFIACGIFFWLDCLQCFALSFTHCLYLCLLPSYSHFPDYPILLFKSLKHFCFLCSMFKNAQKSSI